MSIRLNRRVIAKTANYTIAQAKGDAVGTLFTNRGATGPVTFTLPAPTKATIGWWYEFAGVAAFSITVVSAAIDQMVAINDPVASGVALVTASQIVGGRIRVDSDGVSWIAQNQSVGATMTITA